MAPVFQGWNVWQVWQLKDLPFSVMMFGVSPERQLRIWVEDQVRLNAGGSDVGDPGDLKGSSVQIIDSAPGLAVAMRKEDVPGGATFVVSGPATLFTVRFFNKGAQTQLPWPHDDEYLLDAVLEPKADNPATSGPAPTTIGESVGHGIVKPIEDAVGSIPWYVWAGAIAFGGVMLLGSLPGSTVRKVTTWNKKKKK